MATHLWGPGGCHVPGRDAPHPGTFLIGTAPAARPGRSHGAAADPGMRICGLSANRPLGWWAGFSVKWVRQAIDSGRRVYGLNTLLGSGRDTAVAGGINPGLQG